MSGLNTLLSNKINKILFIFGVIYAGCSLSYLLNLMTESDLFSFSGFSIPVFAIVYVLERKLICNLNNFDDKANCRRHVLYTAVLSGLLGMSFILGYQLSKLGMTSLGVKGKLFILIVSGGVGVAFMPIIHYWFILLHNIRDGKVQQLPAFSKKGRILSFLISWGVIFVSWIPAFLAYYPAIMSYDFHRQSQEAYKGYIWFNSHHPLVHTFLIRTFLMWGESLGSYQTGMAIFSVLQMLVLSLVFAYACNMVGRMTNRKWAVMLTVGLFAFLPIHPVLALSMTKDILFTAFFLLLFLLLLEYNRSNNKKMKIILFVAIIVTGILAMLFRNNAVYAFAIFAVFYIIWSKKERFKIFLLCALIIAGGLLGANGIQKAMDAGSGSKVEMYSVSIQQFTRVAQSQGESLPQEEYALIDYYVNEEFWPNYNPALSDPVKANVAVTSFLQWKEDIPQMIKDWATIGLHYPNDYIDAFLALTGGYWFLDDVSHAEVLGYGEDTNLGLLYTFNASVSDAFEGVESHSYLPGLLKFYQKVVNGNMYYKWPVISNLFKPAFYCWILIVVMLSLAYLKKGKKQILCLLPLCYLFTLLLGPVVNMRYVYPIIVIIPVLIAWLFSDWQWEKKDICLETNQKKDN